jgi:tricorn protease
MDTVLREPVRITDTPEEESEPVFLPDGGAVLFVSEREGRSDLWKAERYDPARWWWQCEDFRLTRLTNDAATESALSVSPDGDAVAWVRGRGELVVADAAFAERRVLFSSHSGIDYTWSPDGRYLAFAADDSNSNRDVWIAPADGSSPPVNVSRHPFDEYGPAWSPDGKVLAFLARRRHEGVDVHYVWLDRADEEETSRDRQLRLAREKMEKTRKEKDREKAKADATPAAEDAGKTGAPEPLVLDGLWRRVRTISIADSDEGGLFWAGPDRLAFTAKIGGKRGTYSVQFPDELKPKLLTTTIGSGAEWSAKAKKVFWLTGGSPAALTGGKNESYGFSVRLEVDRVAHQRAAFDQTWRTMRDWYYDPNLNNRDWDAVRSKYREEAARAPDRSTFGRIVSLMLGELNGSHLGFSAARDPAPPDPHQWPVVTRHLGVRFDLPSEGPGLRVAFVFPEGPADRERSRLEVGELVLSVDGVEVDGQRDPTLWLNGPAGVEAELLVRSPDGTEREVRLMPGNRSSARSLLYRHWIWENERKVAERSGGRLGYLHVRAMHWSSFESFQRAIYAAGHGRDGLVIDVRENGGGFTADHLLTALSQPVHAYTVNRGANPGYPQDRTVYATWPKPIVVLANQNSFSNAEIFAHAVRTLERGKLVGVRTAGGVISTSGRRVMDMGTIRVPLRGWFLIDTGEDLERNGAVPHHEIWPEPGEWAAGRDRQLDKAVEVLLVDVEAWRKEPPPPPRYASER